MGEIGGAFPSVLLFSLFLLSVLVAVHNLCHFAPTLIQLLPLLHQLSMMMIAILLFDYLLFCQPVTMYPLDYLSKLPKMGQHTGTAYAMAHGIGRSYRYYKGAQLPFLRLSVSCVSLPLPPGQRRQE